MASLTQWTWVWASSGRWWRTGEPGVLQSMGSQRVRHDWVNEQQQQTKKLGIWQMVRKLKMIIIIKKKMKKCLSAPWFHSKWNLDCIPKHLSLCCYIDIYKQLLGNKNYFINYQKFRQSKICFSMFLMMPCGPFSPSETHCYFIFLFSFLISPLYTNLPPSKNYLLDKYMWLPLEN